MVFPTATAWRAATDGSSARKKVRCRSWAPVSPRDPTEARPERRTIHSHPSPSNFREGRLSIGVGARDWRFTDSARLGERPLPALVDRAPWCNFFGRLRTPLAIPMRGATSGDAAKAADRPFDGEATSPRASRIGMGAGRLPSLWSACVSLMVGEDGPPPAASLCRAPEAVGSGRGFFCWPQRESS